MSYCDSRTRIPIEPLSTTDIPATRSTNCPKCGIVKKSGKYSCCARGGAWFKKCGNAKDQNFDHSWSEGMQSCEGIAVSIPFEGPLQVLFRHIGNFDLPSNTTQSRNGVQRKTAIYCPDSTSSVATKGSTEYVVILKMIVCISIFYQSVLTNTS